MQRRNFVKAVALAPALAATESANASQQGSIPVIQKEVYEWREYTFNFNSPLGAFEAYLKDALIPALNRLGAKNIGVFREMGKSDPARVCMLIPHATLAAYAEVAERLAADTQYQQKAAAYLALPPEPLPYLRQDTWLMTAFTGFPKIVAPKSGSRIFELRSYEGYSEDAVRRKVRMFNEAEFPIFDRAGLHSVFFGEVIAGKDMPRLTYLLAFRDMEERDINWAAFLSDPDWKALLKDPQYAYTVSKICKTFLVPTDYSQL